ncbi:subtilisin-like protein [Pluteus cervinus]|uniref:Subtilisin-like protein n=1 Tax=Pluteus cervinus TaxID=181527 RepID=A0ACD3B9P8_9AGAR|nr:subtilisin-like protein [Pluteus cervinus]
MHFLALLTALAGLALAIPAPSPHVVHETRAVDPNAWSRGDRLDADKVLPLRIGLSQSNLDQIEDLLMSVSHPESPSYGKHLSPSEVVEIFAPSDTTIDTVKIWLIESGFTLDRIKLSSNKGWLQLNAKVSEIEDLLKTEYHVYTHEDTGTTQFGCHSYSLPKHIQEHVDLIKPTVHFNHRPKPQQKIKRAGNIGQPGINGPKQSSKKVHITPSLENCDQFITLDCLRALYDFHYTPVATHKNTFGIVEFTPQAFLAGDLDLFFKNFTPSLVGVRPVPIIIDGAVVQTFNQSFDTNGESDLDLEYGMSLVDPQPVLLLQTGDLVEGAGFDNWLDAVDGSFCTFDGGDDPTQDGIYPDPLPGGFKGPESCGIITPPNVVSVSYGQDESTVTAPFAFRQCLEYGKLGLLGSSILYSSGDFGVAGFDGVCLNEEKQPVVNGTVFNPDFPVTCPFVTAVGATQVNPGSTVNDPEGACEQVIFSGGGFSNIFPMPSYQAELVSGYLERHAPRFPQGTFNNSGNARGFPDIAANGANYIIGIDGEFELVFGTSCSAPVTSSMITMINDARIARGKGPVGFLNPLLYSSAGRAALNDITMGGNQGCGTPGFQAIPGWDPVTGNGTPNFPKLLELLLSLP